MGNSTHTYIELALAYAHAALFDEAAGLLLQAPPTDPMIFYYLGWVQAEAGNVDAARAAFAYAKAMPPDYCFPNEVECVAALETAIAHDPTDARAPYYLGNFWYAHRRYDEAIGAWEQARSLDPSFPTVHRNLGIAYANKRGDFVQARACYTAAFALDPTDARVLFEYDQLAKRLGVLPAERLAFLTQHMDLVDRRDDLTVEYITLLNLTGQHDAALSRLLARTFHPWEGGEGKVTGQYVAALVVLAQERLRSGDAAGAVDLLARARVYPPNLGEGKLPNARENQIDYWLGCAYRQMGEPQQAAAHFELAAAGSVEPAAPLYYNDQPPDMILYQAFARRELGDRVAAQAIAQGLLDYGRTQAAQTVSVDYFAVSLPDFLVFDDDLQRRHRLHCEYMAGLGYLGLGQGDEAAACFDRVLAEDPAHLGAALHRKLAAA